MEIDPAKHLISTGNISPKITWTVNIEILSFNQLSDVQYKRTHGTGPSPIENATVDVSNAASGIQFKSFALLEFDSLMGKW